jgi:cytochrome c biogenesis protein
MTVTASRPVKKPAPKVAPPGPWTRAYRVLRKGWRRLTSMRTALILLFLLAVAAVPGSLLPQRALNPTKVSNYYAQHKTLAPVLSRFGFFDVFGAPWFAAIYLLLAVSLVGCLIPRIRLHYKAIRTKPLPAPRNLGRLPESASLTVDGDVTAEQVARALGRRWRRIVRTDDKTGAPTVSAEKGYSRETGNLLFHVSLLAALFAIAIGRLWGYSGSVVVVQGTGFCNVVQQFDSWRPGRFQEDGRIAPFCIDSLNKFTANYLPTGEPSTFAADVTYSEGANGTPRPDRIEVNHPLRIEGDRIYLIGHGFAPRVTVRLPDGEKYASTAAFIPTDPTTFLSEGAFKFPGLEAKNGASTQDIGMDGFFAPTPAETAKGVYTSIAPQAKNPVLGLTVYRGDLGLSGGPQSVYSIDQDQVASGKLKKIGMVNLTQGQTKSFAGGVTVTFDGWMPWASMQVSHDPAQGYLLIAAVGMVVGLIGSLGVRRRRVWVKLTPAAAPNPSTSSATTQSSAPGSPADVGSGPARTVIEVGGLARSDAGDFHGEFGELMKRLESGLAGTPGHASGGVTSTGSMTETNAGE